MKHMRKLSSKAVQTVSNNTIQNNSNYLNLCHKFLDFYHPSIDVTAGVHGDGIIATNDIPMGSIIMIDTGLFSLQSEDDIEPQFQALMKQQITPDPDITHLLQRLYANPLCDTVVEMNFASEITTEMKQEIDNKHNKEHLFHDLATFYTNEYAGDVFPLLSKINHGFPTNVGIYHVNVDSMNKGIVVATNDIKASQELCYDYFNLLKYSKDNKLRLNLQSENFKIPIAEDLYKNFVAEDGKYAHCMPAEASEHDDELFNIIVNDIYSNGITSGFIVNKNTHTQQLCPRKQLMKHMFILNHTMEKTGKDNAFEKCGLFTQIAKSKINPTRYNQFIEATKQNIHSDYVTQELKSIFALYGVGMPSDS